MTMKKFLLNRPIQMNCRTSAILSRKIKLLGNDNIDHMGVSAYLSLIGGGGGGHLFEAGRLFE